MERTKPWQAATLAALVLLAAPVPAVGKWVQGRASLAPQQARVIAKFCFDFNAACGSHECSDAEKPGRMDFNLSAGRRLYPGSVAAADGGSEDEGHSTPKLYIAFLDDEYFSYPEVSQVWGEANCSDVLKASKKSVRLDWPRVQTSGGQRVRVPLLEKVRPRWWYVALVSCSAHAFELSYSMHLENHRRGWQSEFSMDAMGVSGTALGLSLVFGGLMAAQVRSLYEWRGPGRSCSWSGLHPVLLLLTASVFLSLIGNLCWLLYYWYFMQSGEGLERWAVLARAAIISAKTLMQIMLMLLAQGRCVCSSDIAWTEHKELLAGMILFGALSLVLELWGDSEFWTTTTEFVYDTRPGCALVAFDVLWLWNYAARSCETFRRETRVRPRRFYRRYGPVFGLWFAALPLIAALARGVAPWVRFGVTFAASGLAHAAGLAVLVHSFRPAVAEGLYELKAHACEAADDAELERFLGQEEDMI